MPIELINTIIDELKNELKSKYPEFRGIYLFGSYARGDAREDSDIDLAIVFDKAIDWRFKDEISSLIWIYMIKYEVIIDNLVFDINDIYEPKTPLRENIKLEGLFYEY